MPRGFETLRTVSEFAYVLHCFILHSSVSTTVHATCGSQATRPCQF